MFGRDIRSIPRLNGESLQKFICCAYKFAREMLVKTTSSLMIWLTKDDLLLGRMHQGNIKAFKGTLCLYLSLSSARQEAF